ncbi:MAG: YceI family protein [Myxococcales bacterium]|nr:YceI family protein [Myxococcales bacterium]
MRITTAVSLSLALALIMSGCAKDPSKEVAAAKVAEPAPAAAPKAAAAANAPTVATAPAAAKAGAEIALSGDIIFVGSKVTGSHTCKFDKWSGTLKRAGDKVEGGELRIEVETSSVVTDFEKPVPVWSAKLAQHLTSKAFFDSKNHPKATFTSTSIKLGGADGKGTHTVAGTLTIRGQSKTITFVATFDTSGAKVAAEAKFSINRKDFGIAYTGKADDLIRDDVVLSLKFKG